MLTTIAAPSFLKLDSDTFLPVIFISKEENPNYYDFYPRIFSLSEYKLLYSKKELLNKNIVFKDNYKLHNQDTPLDEKGFRKLILKGIREARELEIFQKFQFNINIKSSNDFFHSPNVMVTDLYFENFGSKNIGNLYDVTFKLTYQDRDVSDDISIIKKAFTTIENNSNVVDIEIKRYFDLPIKSEKFLISQDSFYVSGSNKNHFFLTDNIDEAKRYSQKEIDKFLDKDILFKEKFTITKDLNSIKF
jgi:hypothetical protein